MRRLTGLVVVAAALSACAHSSVTSGTGIAATPSTVSSNPNPCDVAGTCSVTVEIPNAAVANQLEREGANYKVYPGCPRTLGFREPNITGFEELDNRNNMRGAVPMVQSLTPTVVIPGMSGQYATVGIFFRSRPDKYAVVDFSKGPNQAVTFGYIYNGRSLATDKTVDTQNRTVWRQLCP